jgi:hypothetical protein
VQKLGTRMVTVLLTAFARYLLQPSHLRTTKGAAVPPRAHAGGSGPAASSAGAAPDAAGQNRAGVGAEAQHGVVPRRPF